jgi:predicted ABC-type ATPase
MNKFVQFLRGLPGSGKDTYVWNTYTQKQRNVVVCSADEFMTNELGEYEFKPERLALAHERCKLKFVRSIRQLRDDTSLEGVVLNNTNIETWEFETYRETARLAGFEPELLVIGLTNPTVEYIKMLAERNVHKVPAETIFRMALRWQPDRADWYQS